jgi:hypothetical protein
MMLLEKMKYEQYAGRVPTTAQFFGCSEVYRSVSLLTLSFLSPFSSAHVRYTMQRLESFFI